MKGLRSVWQNPWTIVGAVLAVLSVLFFASFQFFEFLEPSNNPYTGLWSFLILPAVLVFGLLLIPIGWLMERRRRRRYFPGIREFPRYPRLDLNDPRHRKLMSIFGAGTLVFLPFIGVSSYKGYHYTDSTQFCGQVCHSVMHPEFTTYLNSPHARVSCAECHIGPGADWYVKSKISGVRQIFAVAFKTYSKPIPTPIIDLRPARETCEQCHWPAKFFGAQLRSRVHYASDEVNTRREIRVLVKTGGGDSSSGPASGIHWHMALSHKIEYVALDSQRMNIPWVRATDSSGRVTVYRSDGKSVREGPPTGEVRVVDCMDCHNRPTHVIQPPDRAVNISLETGRLDRTLPYIKQVAVEALTLPFSIEEEADRKIETFIREFYEKRNPKLAELRKASINQGVDEVRSIFRRNFFPRMKVDWRIYPDHIGHMIFDGCFRCHDGRHTSDDGRVVRKECNVCHEFQQPVSGNPEAFQTGTIEHPVALEGKHANLKCSSCHTGGRAPDRTCAGCHVEQREFILGKHPLFPEVPETPSSMANVDCEGCHDLTKPKTLANLGAKCDECHEKGYGEMITMWKEEAAASREKALAAIGPYRGSLSASSSDAKTKSAMIDLLSKMEAAITALDKAAAVHNPEYADSIYQGIIRVSEARKKSSVTQ